MNRQVLYETEVLRVWADHVDGAHDIWHLRRVWALAQQIAAQVGAGDLEVIEAAAFMHDIINPPKNGPLRQDAAQLSGAHAAGFLGDIGFDQTKVAGVVHAIEAHSFSAGLKAETLEAQILQDADRLEALGALGIARCFNVSGQMGGALFHGEDPLATTRDLDERAYALDHFETKLFRVAEGMNTEPGKRMAQERADFMRLFREQLLREVT